MLIFVDESGDSGFKLEKGSSQFFVVSLVIFDDQLEAEKTAVAIKQLRRDLGFSDETEFKFSKSRFEVREKFLRTISSFNFRVRSIVVNKSIVTSAELRGHKEKFYGYFVKQVLLHNKGTILGASIKIDGTGPKDFRKSFQTYIKTTVNTSDKKIISDLKIKNSKSDVLIQMADMIVGVIRSNHESRRASTKLYQIIQDKVEDEWIFR